MNKSFGILNHPICSKEIEFRTLYYSLVELIVQCQYENTASALNDLRRDENACISEIEIIRRLIAIRLSIKRGDPVENPSWLEMEIPDDSWLAAERSFVRGHLDFHHSRFESGSRWFADAERRFTRTGMMDRAFLSAFNAIIGEVSVTEPLAPTKQLSRLRDLEARIRENPDSVGSKRVLAMIHRQKSHALEDLGRPHASIEEISKAIPIFELYGPMSDFHLAVLHSADICLDIGDTFRARAFFELVFPPVDARIEFPLAYVGWRLGGEIPLLDSFVVVPCGWKEKFLRLSGPDRLEKSQAGQQRSLIWDSETGEILGAKVKKPIRIKPASMEGRLIRILMQEKASKMLLTETFWPEQSFSQLLDNRLHRMIFRLNRKLPGLVHFDGKHYQLSSELHLR